MPSNSIWLQDNKDDLEEEQGSSKIAGHSGINCNYYTDKDQDNDDLKADYKRRWPAFTFCTICQARKEKYTAFSKTY